ncbi:hypothetical protein CHS0354_011280 [Potamilus streckersoni]|uniref:Uncharacterized protein n=1 Tax=Potamilus streckersoni TaxID=2493646 RepID=A0AAE0S8F9_9BIVA|nr:hypothetical protein CHS0354_011280 [Potamilus streckersoni]
MTVTMLFSVSIVILQTVILISQEAQLGSAMYLSPRRDRQRLSRNRSGIQMPLWGYSIRTGNIQRHGRNINQQGPALIQRNQDEVFHQSNVRSFERNQPIEENLFISSPQRPTEVGDIFSREDGIASNDDDKTENGDNQGYWSRAQTGLADLLCELCRRDGRTNCVNMYCNK